MTGQKPEGFSKFQVWCFKQGWKVEGVEVEVDVEEVENGAIGGHRMLVPICGLAVIK